MAVEYSSLSIMAILFSVAWFPASVGKARAFGGKWLASNRNPIPGKELEPWAARCERAHNNLKDNLPAYIVAIIVLGQLNKFDTGTAIASVTFVAARLLHFISYGIGNVTGRAALFFLGLFANLYLLLKIFL
jgi:uncharacterized MAPEG superfamily protein